MLPGIQRCLALFCIGLLSITSFSASAQDDTIPANSGPFYEFLLAGMMAYVAPGTDGVTTDIYVRESITVVRPWAYDENLEPHPYDPETARQLLEEAGWIDHDNDPTTPLIDHSLLFFAEVTNVTNTEGTNEVDPVISPDGNYIAYRGEANPSMYPNMLSVFVVGGDGQDKVQITPDGVNARYVVFSPDSRQVAFSAIWENNRSGIYRSDINGENLYTLASGADFFADFPDWRVNENGEQEISYILVSEETSEIATLDPLTGASQQVSETPMQQWILQRLNGQYHTLIQREDSNSDWEVAIRDMGTGTVTQLTNNTTNDCCAAMPVVADTPSDLIDLPNEVVSITHTVLEDRPTVVVLDQNGNFLAGGAEVDISVWPSNEVVGVMHGDILEEEEPRGTSRLSIVDNDPFFLSDTEDGRDIYSVSLNGSNLINHTANDERVYTSVTPLTGKILLVGHEEEDGTNTLGILDTRDGGYTYLTEGSDPDVRGWISLTQLDELADVGVLQSCELIVDEPTDVHSDPHEDAPVVRELDAGDTVSILAIFGSWAYTIDGDWIDLSSTSISVEDSANEANDC